MTDRVASSSEAAAAIQALPDDLRSGLEDIARERGISPEEALADLVHQRQSLDRIENAGWRLLVEKDGDVRELAEA